MSKIMSDRIIIVRAGDNSLHPAWLDAEPNRKWHLHISYFGRRPDPYDLPPGVSISRDSGQKWIGLLSCLKENPHLLDYKRIAFPDDDLKMVTGSWDGLFDIAESSDASICQPSLDHRSFYSHDVTLNRSWLEYREVNFIELMAPVFDSIFLPYVIPYFDENKSSFGIDYIWSQIALDGGKRLVISDNSVVLHTRAVGKGSQYSGLNPRVELDMLIAKYGITARPRKSIRGFRDGKPVKIPKFLLNRKELAPRIFKRLKMLLALELIG